MTNRTYSSGALTLAGGRFVAAPPTGRPAWRTAMAVNTWAQAPGVLLSTLNPANDPTENPMYPGDNPWRAQGGHDKIIESWSGGVWDEIRGGFWLWGGGHNDYAGNEVYFWSPVTGWERINSPSGGLKTKVLGNVIALNDGGEGANQYADGQPRAMHTYNNVFMDANNNLCCTGGSQYSSGGNGTHFWRFDHTLKKWNRVTGDTGVYISFGSAMGLPNGDVYSIGQSDSRGRLYNHVTNTWSGYGPYPNSEGWCYNRLVYDPLFGGAVYLRQGNLQYWTPTALTNIVTSGTAPTFYGEAGLAFDAPRRRYLVWNGGPNIYTLTAPIVGSNPQTATWVWGLLTPSNGSSPTTGCVNGTYGRFWASAALGACGVINRTSETMSVFSLE